MLLYFAHSFVEDIGIRTLCCHAEEKWQRQRQEGILCALSMYHSYSSARRAACKFDFTEGVYTLWHFQCIYESFYACHQLMYQNDIKNTILRDSLIHNAQINKINFLFGL